MKKVLLIALVTMSLTSCMSYSLPAPITIVRITDYSVFKENGLYVTESSAVNFNYEAVGHISIEQDAGWIKEKGESKMKVEKKTYNDDYYLAPAESASFGKNKYVMPNIEDAVSLFANKIRSMGGNGVMNLKFEYISNYDLVNPKIKIYKIIISGMAIKR